MRGREREKEGERGSERGRERERERERERASESKGRVKERDGDSETVVETGGCSVLSASSSSSAGWMLARSASAVCRTA